VPAAPTESREPGRNKHILVVDDEASIREAARVALTREGYRVTLASNGKEGLEQFRLNSDTVCLLLTDLMMPVMDGAALIRAVRAENRRIPIVAVSGLEDQAMRGDLGSAGVDVFLTKPFSIFTLADVVAQQLQK
jgi:CheY-like chemotaxis protein